VELKLLRALFTEPEARVAVHLSALAEPVEVIQKRVGGISRSELDTMLKRLSRKGAIAAGVTRVGNRPVRTYGLAPLVVGMFEFQVDRLTAEYVHDFHEYLDDGFRDSVVGARTSQLRTVPVRAGIGSQRTVSRYNDIRSYIRNHDGPFSVINCVCRQSAGVVGEACTTSSTHETCLMIGQVAPHGRELTADGVIEILDRAEREGHVLQPQNSRRPSFICCCCRDCCEVLRNARKLPRPADAVASAHRAAVNERACTGCRTCLKRCPMDAITITDRVATVDESRCIGCGLCATSCPEDAITIVRRRRSGTTPRTNTMMYLRMYFDRWGLPGVLRLALRWLLRRKI
jgi:ferredoxin